MATRRMFSKTIVVDSDDFLDMPVSARLLYYDLGMRADDDGFVSPKMTMKITGASDDDLKVLLAKKYVIGFESKVLVIRDWKVNNFIRPDRYTPTIYKEYLNRLKLAENNQYQLTSGIPDGIPKVYPDQVRIGKDRIGKGKKNSAVGGFGNADINFLMDKLKTKFNLSKLDGTEKMNRRYAYLAIKKFGSKEKVSELIDIAAVDKFWSGQITSFRYLYYNGVKIENSTKNNFNSSPKSIKAY